MIPLLYGINNNWNRSRVEEWLLGAGIGGNTVSFSYARWISTGDPGYHHVTSYLYHMLEIYWAHCKWQPSWDPRAPNRNPMVSFYIKSKDRTRGQTTWTVHLFNSSFESEVCGLWRDEFPNFYFTPFPTRFCPLQAIAWHKGHVLDVLVHNLWGHSLEVHPHRALVEVRQQSLTIAHEEVELVRWQLPQHQSTDLHLVSSALQDKLVSKAAGEGAQHKLAKKNILHCSLCSVVLPIQVTWTKKAPQNQQSSKRKGHPILPTLPLLFSSISGIWITL